jgi:prolyl 4-hydroxylase
MAKDRSILGFGRLVDVLLLLLSIIIIIASLVYFKTRKSTYVDPQIIKHSHQDYEVLEIYNLLTPEECNEIIQFAKDKGMHESDVLSYGTDSGTAVNNDYRKSKTAWLQDDDHPLCMRLAQYSEQITTIPRENQEMLQVAHYEPNGKFNEHFDACAYDNKDYCDKMNNYSGQRRSTLLIYLNDDFEGGETEFVQIGLKIKPEKGKGILFWNVDEDENIIEKSKHRGNPVLKGEKWICTKWSHVHKYS